MFKKKNRSKFLSGMETTYRFVLRMVSLCLHTLQSFCLSIDLFIFSLSVYHSIFLSICLISMSCASFSQSINLSITQSLYLSAYLYINNSIFHQSINQSVKHSVSQSVYLSNRISITLFIRRSIYPSSTLLFLLLWQLFTLAKRELRLPVFPRLLSQCLILCSIFFP